MITIYDCTADVLEHRKRVSFWIDWLTDALEVRAKFHDESKLKPPEKAIFDEYTPVLKVLDFGSESYHQALEKMDVALDHHYRANQHHPESHRSGIDGMTIWDLVEMLADWMAASSVKNKPMDLDYLQRRFYLSPQLRHIIANTLYEADMDSMFMHVPLEFQQINNFLSNEDCQVFIEAKNP